MKQREIFDGATDISRHAIIAYQVLMTRQMVGCEDVLAEYLKQSKAKGIPCSVSKYSHYKALKLGFQTVRKAIIDQWGENSIVDNGKSLRSRKWQYVGNVDDPLSDLRNAAVIKELKIYWDFCQDSAGFFPKEWLDYFFRNSMDLLEIKKRRRKGENVISSSLDNVLKNKEILPVLYQHIKEKRVIEFTYEEYNKTRYQVIFHPHYLKEYNGRWLLYGYKDQDAEMGKITSCALDRIIPESIVITSNAEHNYSEAPKNYYDDFFHHRVGVSSYKYGDKPEFIRIRTLTRYMHGIVTTKPFVKDQNTSIDYGEHEDGTYGEIVFEAVINNELVGRILQMGGELHVIESPALVDIIAKRVSRMNDLYKNLDKELSGNLN